MEKKVIVTVEYAGDNLSAYIEGAPIITTGNTLKEIKSNIKEAVELYLESCQELNIAPLEQLVGELTYTYNIDTATLINYYSNIFTKAALSRITGINERQLWHYAAGVHKPRRAQLQKIQNGINSLSGELASISVI